MTRAVRNAIERQLSYLVDNRYRYVHLGGYDLNDPIVLSHDRQILELREALANDTNTS